MKLRLTPRALQDIAEIADYIRARNPAAARRVWTAVYDSLRTLIRFPFLGRPQTVAGVRKLVTKSYPYLVYYTVDEGAAEIVILNVKHPARERLHVDA